jgi:hypothetical protein
LRPKKRKSPKYLFLFFLFKVNTPKFLEVDYFSLSIILLKKQDAFVFSSFSRKGATVAFLSFISINYLSYYLGSDLKNKSTILLK